MPHQSCKNAIRFCLQLEYYEYMNAFTNVEEVPRMHKLGKAYRWAIGHGAGRGPAVLR